MTQTTPMIALEIDGLPVEVPQGSMVMHAVQELGKTVPHFCYHKKLSIAANCRMCLVEVEKAPKPLPACATPVAAGMKVFTHSEKAVAAQSGVMEMILINHPLDCPICDQGGECQLQDVAMGYGGSGASQYDEEKRAVENKDLGPLITTEMTRCINCTRCVRFGQEIAGDMELGQANRGEHAEITTFINQTVNSELSGNMIDICPVGALTSKPFRYKARSWELSRRKTVSMHDSLGTTLIAQVKNNQVYRMIPMNNENINEEWCSDKDRFAYTGLYENRLTAPMIKNRETNAWSETTWENALTQINETLSQPQLSKVFATTNNATCEELFLFNELQKNTKNSVKTTRLTQTDKQWDECFQNVLHLSTPIAQFSTLTSDDNLVFMGGNLRKDHPVLAQRIRHSVKKGLTIQAIHHHEQDWAMNVATGIYTHTQDWVSVIAAICVEVAVLKHVAAPVHLSQYSLAHLSTQVLGRSKIIAQRLCQAKNNYWLFGNEMNAHHHATAVAGLTQWLSEQVNLTIDWTVASANEVGSQLLQTTTNQFMWNNSNTANNTEAEHDVYVLMNMDVLAESMNPQKVQQQLKSAKSVVCITPFIDETMKEFADVLLPSAAMTETAGTFINANGFIQSFNPVTKPQGGSKPTWKILTALLLKITENNNNICATIEQLRENSSYSQVLNQEAVTQKLSQGKNKVTVDVESLKSEPQHYHHSIQNQQSNETQIVLKRVAPVHLYDTDMVVRRSKTLQQTKDAQNTQFALIHQKVAQQLQLNENDKIVVQTLNSNNIDVIETDIPVKILTQGIDEHTIVLSAHYQVGERNGFIVVRK